MSKDFSVDPNTFEMTIRNATVGKSTYTCISKPAEGEQEMVDPVRLMVYGKDNIC